MRKPSFAVRVVVGLITIALIAGGSYLFEAKAKAQGSMTGQLVPVVQHDAIVAYVDSGAVGQLSEQEKEVKGEAAAKRDDQAASLDFVLNSAGITAYSRVEIGDIADNDNSLSLTRQEAAKVVLRPGTDGTVSLLAPEQGDKVLIKIVGKLYVAD
ncbi:hypothetical protein DesLBE_1679 [Desulfitobacterium sp. LBE]|uniref:Uncharacterized protein n=2 Tax=Desulfitobacterium hafniense TaxID=49338 RepID=A0A0W1JCH6_DESHA|nr:MULTISPECIES: hypothetical protein [Desulfitobacterium]EHL08395.1 hypothetical protein HMPREF0322_00893 [Desulfitobacterium hafniense DP7]KTE89569.1 hypothetical protein AT727_12100 [Desulfitobacterium hafniense]TWH57404.1 hypothetical protein DesLBE_1679 [Desulfitobacterium sp. LBE]